MLGTESHGCGEHWRTSENARDEILHNKSLAREYLEMSKKIFLMQIAKL